MKRCPQKIVKITKGMHKAKVNIRQDWGSKNPPTHTHIYKTQAHLLYSTADFWRKKISPIYAEILEAFISVLISC